MTLNVEPEGLRVYAGQLEAARETAETARSYVRTTGDFSLHERGAIGVLFSGHHNYLDALSSMRKT